MLLLEEQNATLVADLRESGVIAAVFTNSASTRALQLKGRDAREVALENGDEERMTAHAGALVEWGSSGQPEAFTPALLARPPSATVLAYQFTPYVAFDQTPGPGRECRSSEGRDPARRDPRLPRGVDPERRCHVLARGRTQRVCVPSKRYEQTPRRSLAPSKSPLRRAEHAPGTSTSRCRASSPRTCSTWRWKRPK